MDNKYILQKPFFLFFFGLFFSGNLFAELNDSCVVNILNRSVQVSSDGNWSMPNVPANQGRIRARATCTTEDGKTVSGQSDYFSVVTNGIVDSGAIVFEGLDPIPAEINYSSTDTVQLSVIGGTYQLAVTAVYSDASTKDVTAVDNGTNYSSTNAAVASVDSNGIVTAIGNGFALINARKDGALASRGVQVNTSGDLDGDGIPDDYENENGLNPNDPVDAFEDIDKDGLSALEEYNEGTNVNLADTDGDTIKDGEEVVAGEDGFITNALLADSDGDGLSDALEIVVGSDPSMQSDANFNDALVDFNVTPSSIGLTFNSIDNESSAQLRVTGVLLDDTEIDLTGTDLGTAYSSSDLSVASFGTTAGEVFAGQVGSAIITVSFNDFQAQVNVEVAGFDPVALSTLSIPGYANNVDIAGDYAFVAAGSEGLQVVDVSDRTNPSVVASLDTDGVAIDIRIMGNNAYIADGESGLVIVDISDPLNPQLLSTLATSGVAQDVAVEGAYVYLALGRGGFEIVDIFNPLKPFSKTIMGGLGSVQAVSVDGDTAVILLTSSLHVIDISDRFDPIKLGGVDLYDTKDVELKDGYAYVAADFSGYRVVSIADPMSPQFVGGDASISPRDVALATGFAFFADHLFINALPYVNIFEPENPVFQGLINLAPSSRYAGTGIAVDSGYAYVTKEIDNVVTDYGSLGNTNLFIAQYRNQFNTGGAAPVVDIRSPDVSEFAVEGSKVFVDADVVDDIAVVAVSFLVNDEVVATDTTEPYQLFLDVPSGFDQMSIEIRAVGLGNNVGVAQRVLTVKADADRDGLSDEDEIGIYGTDIDDADSDDDGIDDFEEVSRGLNPLSKDSDGDGFEDNFELDQGTDPLNPDVTPPVFVSATPENTAIDIAENSTILIRFSEKLQVNSVANDGLMLTQDTVPVAGSWQLVSDNTELMFTPEQLLEDYAEYALTVQGVRDEAGNIWVGSYVSRFTVGNTYDVTPPQIVSANPAFAATNVAINTLIRLELSEPIIPASVSEDSFYMNDQVAGGRVSGSITLSANNRVIEFIPDNVLAVGRNYGLVVTSEITDLFGNSIDDYYFTFETSFDVDLLGPVIVNTSIDQFSASSTAYPINSYIAIEFNEMVSSISLLGVSLLDDSGNQVAISRKLSANHRAIILAPKLNLSSDSFYTVLIDGIEDLSGNLIQSSEELSFTTGAEVDVTSPQLVARSPLDNTQNVPQNAVIQFQFDEPVDLGGQDYSIAVYNYTGSSHPAGVITQSEDGRTITFTPDQPLQVGSGYEVFFGGVTDYVGNYAVAQYGRFTVGNSEDHTAPIGSLNITDGAEELPVNARIVLQLDSSVNTVCVNDSTVQLSANDQQITASVSLGSDQRTAIVTPDNVLSADTVYTVSIDGLCDLGGNSLSGYSSSFTTSVSDVSDTTNPTVTILPAYSATAVDVTSAITFSFSEPIDPTTIEGGISITVPTFGGSVAGSFAIDEASQVVTFTPSGTLPSNVQINIDARNVQDLAGNYISSGYNSFFTTGSDVNDVPPVVEMISPVNNSMDMGLYTPVVMTFSEPIDPATISSANFVFYTNGDVIRPQVERSGDNRTVTLNALLPEASLVWVVVSSAVTDLSGNSLPGGSYISNFTTGLSSGVARTEVLVQYPANGSYDVSSDRSVILYASRPLDQSSIAEALYVSQDGVLVDGSLEFIGDEAVKFTPDQPWASDALIQVFLESTALDASSNAVVAYQGQFVVADEVADVSPEIIAVSVSGTISSLNPRLEVLFNKPIDSLSLNDDFDVLYILSEDGSCWCDMVDGAFVWSDDSMVLRFEPDNALDAGRVYGLDIGRSRNNFGLRDLEGNLLASGVWRVFDISADAANDSVAPEVAQMLPPGGSTNVVRNALTKIQFTEAMSEVSITQQMSATDRSVMYSSETQAVTIQHHIPLPADTLITQLVEGVTDVSGNVVIPYSASYETGSGIDVVGPRVVFGDPYQYATDVPINGVMRIEFDEAINPLSLNSTSVYLRDDISYEYVDGIFSLDPDGRTVSFMPTVALPVGRHLQLYYFGIEDVTGNRVGCNYGCSINFTTSFEADTQSPAIERINITDGQSGLPLNVHLRVHFDEAISLTTASNIVVIGPLGEEVSTSLEFSGDYKMLTFIPDVLLDATETYIFEVSGIEDLSGNLIQSSETRSFTTGEEVDVTSPQLVSQSPMFGDESVPQNVVIQLQFDEAIDLGSGQGAVIFLENYSDWNQQPTGVITQSEDGRTITFIPDQPLQAGNGYQTYFGYGYTDYAGNNVWGSSYRNFTVEN